MRFFSSLFVVFSFVLSLSSLELFSSQFFLFLYTFFLSILFFSLLNSSFFAHVYFLGSLISIFLGSRSFFFFCSTHSVSLDELIYRMAQGAFVVALLSSCYLVIGYGLARASSQLY